MAGFDDALRLALWDEWDHRCAWCGNPLDLEDLEVDHVIAKGLELEKRTLVLAGHGLPGDFDLNSTENLVPAHGRPCNRQKAMKPLPDSPRIDLLLADAMGRAAKVDSAAGRHRRAKSLTRAVATIKAADPGEVTKEQHVELVRAASLVIARLGLPPSVQVHPSVDPHDYVPPEVIEASAIFGTQRFGELLDEWANYSDLGEVVADGFNANGVQQLESASVRQVERVGYVEDFDMYLVRVQFDVSYTHYDDDGCEGPADTDVVLDLWVGLDDRRTEVLEVYQDLADTFR